MKGKDKCDIVDRELSDVCTKLKVVAAPGTVRHSIVMLLASGKSRKAIAAELGRSPHTIDDHLKEIYRRTGVRDRLMLAIAVQSIFAPPEVRGWRSGGTG